MSGFASSRPSSPIEAASKSILDRPQVRAKYASVVAGAGAVGVHMALLALATLPGTATVGKAATPAIVTQMIDVELRPEVVSDPAKNPAREQPVHVPAPARARAAVAPREAPAPAAARAGQVLTSSDEAVDFGESFVAGKGASYAGGVTEAMGTSMLAVRDTGARAGGILGSTGTQVNGDRSRAPRLTGGGVWDCPFPLEADDIGMDHAVVTLRVELTADGHVLGASATSDTGHGFGREARRCALSKRWEPGLDRAGNPMGTVTRVNVRFDR